MIPVTYAVRNEKTSPIFARAFAEGCGGTVEYGDVLRDGAVAMFGSPQRWTLLQAAFAQSRTIWYGDHGYFGRNRYFRIAKNRYQHDGTGQATPERFRAHGRTVKPWRMSGRHVLICPQSAVYFRLFGLDVERWVSDVTGIIHEHSDRLVKVRWKAEPRPIEQDLDDCWAVVTFSSSAALDALIAGVPVFVLADFAAAARMGSADLHRIESPVYPDDREPFLWNLACQQWTLEEIRKGEAWRAMQ